MNATVVASAEVAQATETAATEPVVVETAVGGTTSSESPARQMVPRGKNPIITPSPGDFGPSAASVVGRSLEEAMDRMLQEYTAQHQGVKSLIQVITLDFLSVYLLPQPPSAQSTSRLGGRLGTCIFRRKPFFTGRSPLCDCDLIASSLCRSRLEL